MSSKTQGGGKELSVQPPGQTGKPAGMASKLLNGVAVLGALVVFIALGAGGITALHLKARADDPHQIAPLSEPSGPDRLRHAGFERSIFAAQPLGDRPPKTPLLIAPRYRWPSWRRQWRSS